MLKMSRTDRIANQNVLGKIEGTFNINKIEYNTGRDIVKNRRENKCGKKTNILARIQIVRFFFFLRNYKHRFVTL